tara:strand:+ start:298 stop:2505 length:2208 start_codon:yes stop_codon:yes gene_type:complete
MRLGWYQQDYFDSSMKRMVKEMINDSRTIETDKNNKIRFTKEALKELKQAFEDDYRNLDKFSRNKKEFSTLEKNARRFIKILDKKSQNFVKQLKDENIIVVSERANEFIKSQKNPKLKTKKNKGDVRTDNYINLIPLNDTREKAIYIKDVRAFNKATNNIVKRGIILIPTDDPREFRKSKVLDSSSINYKTVDNALWDVPVTEQGKIIQRLEVLGIDTKDKRYLTVIPKDNYGRISEEDILARFFDKNVGKKAEKNTRNTGYDFSKKAEVLLNPDMKVKNGSLDNDEFVNLLSWMRRPNLYDIDGIDVPDSKYRPERASVIKSLILGEPQNAETLKRIIENNFTQREQKVLKDVTFDLRNGSAGGLAGFYQHGQSGNKSKIAINPQYMYKDVASKVGDNKLKIDEDTATHEIVHALRHEDEERLKDKVQNKAVKGRLAGWSMRDQDLEESLTTLETDVRTADPTTYAKGTGASGGYWRHAGLTKDAKELGYVIPEIKSESSKKGGYVEFYDKLLVKKEFEEYKDRFVPKGSNKIAGNFEDFHDVVHDYILEPKSISESETKKKLKKMNLTAKDIKRVAESITTNRKGKQTIKETEKMYPSSLISTLKKNDKKSEAIDNYWKYEETGNGIKPVRTHIHNKDGDQTTQDEINLAVPRSANSGKLVEYNDGKIDKVFEIKRLKTGEIKALRIKDLHKSKSGNKMNFVGSGKSKSKITAMKEPKSKKKGFGSVKLRIKR